MTLFHSKKQCHVINVTMNMDLERKPGTKIMKTLNLLANMDSEARKPVFGVSNKVNFKPANSATETN